MARSLASVREMPYQLVYGTVRESPRQVIHVVRVEDKILSPTEIDDLAERMREWLLSRGVVADVVVVQGQGQETLRLFGVPYSVARVRAAMFNAQINWKAIHLD